MGRASDVVHGRDGAGQPPRKRQYGVGVDQKRNVDPGAKNQVRGTCGIGVTLATQKGDHGVGDVIRARHNIDMKPGSRSAGLRLVPGHDGERDLAELGGIVVEDQKDPLGIS